MKINAVLEKIDGLKPNAYDEETKVAWLSELDGKISMELLNQAFAGYEYPADGNTDLLVPFPYDNVYEHYLAAMIDFMQREYANYNNTMNMFNQAMDEYKKYYRRTNMPEQKNCIQLRG